MMFAAVMFLPGDVIIEDIWYSNVFSLFFPSLSLLFFKFSYILFIFQLDWITFWLCTRVQIEIPKVHFSMKCLQQILCYPEIRGKDNNKIICSSRNGLFFQNERKNIRNYITIYKQFEASYFLFWLSYNVDVNDRFQKI